MAIQLRQGVKYELNNRLYEIKEVFSNKKIQVIDLSYGIQTIINECDIRNELFKGNLSFEVFGRNSKTVNSSNIKTTYEYSAVEMIPGEKNQNKTWSRYIIAREIDNIPEEERNEKSVSEAIKAAVKILKERYEIEIRAMSVRSGYRYYKMYCEGSQDLRALVPATYNSGGPGKNRLDSVVDEIIENSINNLYLSQKKGGLVRPSIKDVEYDVVRRIKEINEGLPANEKLEAPGYNTIWSRILRLDNYKVLLAKYGKKYADNYYLSVGAGVQAERIMQRVEIDHTPLNLIVVDDEDRLPIGNANLTMAKDVYTGYPLGYHISFGPPDTEAILECLYHAISPKNYVKQLYPSVKNDWIAYGVPEELVVDRGKDYQGRQLDFACAQLGIHIQDCPAQKPRYKPRIERQFGTLCKDLIHKLPGTTFSNLLERKDYKSIDNAVISLSELHEIIHIWIIDYYSQKFNRGTKCIPAETWKKEMDGDFPIRYPPSSKELRVLLSYTEERTIQRYGIELNGLYYNSAELLPMRKSLEKSKENKVTIKYRVNDLSKIYVFDLSGKFSVEVPAVDRKYTENLSLYKHQIICNYLRNQNKRVDREALAEAKAEIQEIIERSYKLTKRTTRRKSARYQQLDKTVWSDAEERLEELEKETGFTPVVESGGPNDGISDMGSDDPKGRKDEDSSIKVDLPDENNNRADSNTKSDDKTKNDITKNLGDLDKKQTSRKGSKAKKKELNDVDNKNKKIAEEELPDIAGFETGSLSK